MTAGATSLNETRGVSVVAPYDLVTGQAVQIGLLFGVSGGDYKAGQTAVVSVEGKYEFHKPAAESILTGDAVYWDSVNHCVTKDITGNAGIGIAIADSDDQLDRVQILLAPSVQQYFPIVKTFLVQRGIDTNPKTIIDDQCGVGGQIVLAPTNGAAASVPFWAIVADGSFDVHWIDEPYAYVDVNADGTSIAATTTPTQVDIIAVDGTLNFDVDEIANTLTCLVGGLYDFRVSMAGTATRNTTYRLFMRVDGVPQGNGLEYVMSGNIDDFAHSDGGFFPLNAGDVIDFTVETVSGSGTMNFDSFGFQLLRAGYATPEWTTATFSYVVLRPWDVTL